MASFLIPFLRQLVIYCSGYPNSFSILQTINMSIASSVSSSDDASTASSSFEAYYISELVCFSFVLVYSCLSNFKSNPPMLKFMTWLTTGLSLVCLVCCVFLLFYSFDSVARLTFWTLLPRCLMAGEDGAFETPGPWVEGGWTYFSFESDDSSGLSFALLFIKP